MSQEVRPIFIATKGRADTCTTAQKLLAEGTLFTLVVEPQDAAAYAKVFGVGVNMVVLLENNKGVSYARNHILGLARELCMTWFWMLDDDIKDMFTVESKKLVRKPFTEVMASAERVIEKLDNVAVGAMEYGQYAWAAKKESVLNSYCDVAVLINVKKTQHIQYREACKEDRDFVLQCLASGYDSARSSLTAFAVPKNGSNKGGLHDAYASGLETHWSAKMVALWPGVCEHKIKKDGRPDVKIHWKKLRSVVS